ncbi:MAG: O-antigen ligase family protein [Clostridia bacterium]|nr:O-antigen ligase family protein [Clostridia bacterium]
MTIRIKKYNSSTAGDNPSQEIINLLWYSIIITDIVRKITRVEWSVSLIRNGLYVLVFLYVLWHAFKKRNIAQILLPGVGFALLLGISVLLYPEVSVLVEENVLLFYGRCLTGFYLALNIKDWRKVLSSLASWHWIGFLYAIIVFSVGLDMTENYMSFSYGLLLPAFITVADGILEKKILRVFSGSVMTIAIFTFGARGPLLCIAVGLIFMIFEIPNGRINYRRFIALGLLIVLVILFASSFDNIFLYLYQRFPHARNILLIISGQMNSLSGRDALFNKAVEVIKINPVLPRGLLADRIILGSHNISANVYPHNFFLEIIIQFGFLGWLFSAWLIYKVLRTYYQILKSGNKILKIAFVSFFITALAKSMFTGSYVSDMQCWFAFGCLISISNSQNRTELSA